jgi:O-antigen polymerase
MRPSSLLVPLCVAVPFLFGYTSAPYANFWPLMVSWGCVTILIAVMAFVPTLSRGVWARGVAAVVVGAFLGGLIGLVQYFYGDLGAAPWIQASTPGQAIGNLRQRNQQATLIALGLWALLWLLAQKQPHGRIGRTGMCKPQGVALCLIVLVLALGAAATASRTGALQWLLVPFLLLLWRRSLGVWTLAVAVLALLVYAVGTELLPMGLEQWTGQPAERIRARFADDGQGCGGRRALWANVVQLVLQRPWTGWGWGELDYAHYAAIVPEPRFCVLLDNAHNLPLHLAVELGIPVAVMAVLAVLVWAWRAKPWHERGPARQLTWGVLALIGVHSLLEFPLWYGPFQLVVLMALALLWRGGRPALLGVAWARGVCWTSITLAVCAGGYASWDYWRVSQLYRTAADRAPAYRSDTAAKVSSSWLFADQVDFAALTTTSVTRDNAARMLEMARRLLHYSPEPRVIEPLIESAIWMGRDAEAAFHMRRYRIAYPEDYARWTQRNARLTQALQPWP